MKDRFFDPVLLKFSLGLLGFAFFLSLFVGFFSGASLYTVFLRAVISAVLMGLMGASVYFVITAFIPEMNELWQTLFQNSYSNSNTSIDTDVAEDLSATKDSSLGDAKHFVKNSFDESLQQDLSYKPELSDEAIKQNKKNRKVADDEILVEGVAIKNDKGVMAEAVRQVLDQDSD